MAKFDPSQFEIVTGLDGRRVISLAGGGGGAALPWYNVKDVAYGALGDDSTDDYAAFIAARDAIWAAGDPAVLYVPSGSYRLSNFIQLQSEADRPMIMVLGDYARMRPTTDTSVFYRKWDDSADFSTIEQMLIDGFWFDPVTPGNSTGIHTVDSFATIIKNCRFTNLKIGVHIQSVDSWNEGMIAEDILIQGCTTGYDFNAPGGTGSFQMCRVSRNYISVSAGHTGIKMHSAANMYGSRFDAQIWPQGNDAIGIDIDANIHSCEFRGIIDTAGGSGTPLYAVRFGSSATNTDKAEFAMDFAGTYNGGEEQSGAVKNASSKTWYFDNFLPYGSSKYPRFTLLTTTGDTPYASAANTWARRGIGSAGDISKVSGGVPVWAAPAALTKVDDTNVTVSLTGAATTALINAAGITMGWSGQLSVSRGGSGAATLASNGVLYGNGTSAIQVVAVNSSATKKYLQQFSSGAPTMEQPKFIELSDAPTTFSGQTLKSLRVNAGETAVEFYTPSAARSIPTSYNPDLAPTSPSATDDEFDDDAIGGGWTTVGTPDTLDETTLHGFIHIADNDTTFPCGVYEAYVPGAAAFTVAFKLHGDVSRAASNQVRVGVYDGSGNAIVELGQLNGSAWIASAAALGGGFSSGTIYNGPGNLGVFYGAICRDATTNYILYVSQDGIIWHSVASFSQAGTVGRAYLGVYGVATVTEAYFDFIRMFTSQTTKIGNNP